jgi:hypothetical protein
MRTVQITSSMGSKPTSLIADDLKDYLSCRILTAYQRKTSFVILPHLINNLKEKFEKEVNNLSDYGTAETPRFKIVRSMDRTEKMTAINNQSIVLAWVCYFT